MPRNERLAGLSARRSASMITSGEARGTARNGRGAVSFLVSYIQVHQRRLPCIADRLAGEQTSLADPMR